jgi:hypothetical protein
VLWFYADGKVMICSHGCMKESKKTKRKEIEQAERVWMLIIFSSSECIFALTVCVETKILIL